MTPTGGPAPGQDMVFSRRLRRCGTVAMTMSVVAAGVLACGSPTGGSAPDAALQLTDPATRSDSPCPATHRYPLQLAQPYSLWVVACRNDSGEIWLRNATEAAALHVFVSSGGAAYLTPQTPEVPDSFEKLAVAQSAPTVRYTDGTVTLAPGDALTSRAASTQNYALDLLIDRRSTAIATVAAATAEHISDRLTSPGQRLADSVTSCAESAGPVVDQLGAQGIAPTPESLLQMAYSGNECRMAYNDLNEVVFAEEVDEARTTGRTVPAVKPSPVLVEDAPKLTETTLQIAERSPALERRTLGSFFDAASKAAFRLLAHA